MRDLLEKRERMIGDELPCLEMEVGHGSARRARGLDFSLYTESLTLFSSPLFRSFEDTLLLFFRSSEAFRCWFAVRVRKRTTVRLMPSCLWA